MKNAVKIFGIIAVAAVIGFSMTSCLSLGGGNGGGGVVTIGGGGTADSPGATVTAPVADGSAYASMPVLQWPSNSEWTRVGLSGLQQPPGTSDIVGETRMGQFTIAILNTNKAAFDNLAGQIRAMSGMNVVTEDTNAEASQAVFMRSSATAMNMIILLYSVKDNAVIIQPQ